MFDELESLPFTLLEVLLVEFEQEFRVWQNWDRVARIYQEWLHDHHGVCSRRYILELRLTQLGFDVCHSWSHSHKTDVAGEQVVSLYCDEVGTGLLRSILCAHKLEDFIFIVQLPIQLNSVNTGKLLVVDCECLHLKLVDVGSYLIVDIHLLELCEDLDPVNSSNLCLALYHLRRVSVASSHRHLCLSVLSSGRPEGG